MFEDPDLRGKKWGEETERRPAARGAVTRRAFLKKIGKATLGGAFMAAGGLFYSHDLETTWIDVTKMRLQLPRLTFGFSNYRVVHVSDLHLDDNTDPEYLTKLVRLVNEQQPDLIAFTGDFVTFAAERFASELAITFSRLDARDGVVAVLGNHDYLAGPAAVISAIREGGAAVLTNEVRTLTRAGSSLLVCGIDDAWEGRPRLENVLARMTNDHAALLLVHEPDFADTSSTTGRFDLQLSGHSHGGQVRFPLVGAPVLPRYARKYPMGLYQVGDMLLYTNRGLGMLPPRFRFLCRPEITVLDLNAPPAQAARLLR
jgi:predicted MPP superfamily phosphohydrolase